MAKLTEADRQLVRELAEQDMNLSATARILELNRYAVDWRLDLIHRETGLNPRCFYDLCELLDLIREEML